MLDFKVSGPVISDGLTQWELETESGEVTRMTKDEMYEVIKRFELDMVIESTPRDEPNPLKTSLDHAVHHREQMGGLLQLFQEATLHLSAVTPGGYTWVDALADELDKYEWRIISKDREAELLGAESDLEEINRILKETLNERR